MNRFIEKNKFILVLFSIVICLSCAYGLTAKLDPTVNALGEKTGASDYSWATFSEAATNYLNRTASPSGNNAKDVEVPGSPASGFAGAYLGYLSQADGSVYTIGSIETNTTIYSYTSLNKLEKLLNGNSKGEVWRDSAAIYSGFGYALTSSGIDEPVIIGNTADSKRNIIGPIVLIVFLLCIALPQFFEMVLTFLSVANPFRLFLGADSILNSITPGISAGAGFEHASNATAVTTAMTNALTTLSNMVTELYNMLYSLSFAAIIPIMLAVALFSWLVLRNKASSVFRKLVTRVVFIGIGVPLLLACYTAAIDSVKDFTINAATGTPITLITSTFCDYGTWVLGKNSYDYMRLPEGVKLVVDKTGDTYAYNNTSTSDRRLVQLINRSVRSELAGGTDLNSGTSAEDIAADDIKLVSSIGGNASSEQTSSVINMLQAYTKGEYITSSNFATKMNSDMTSERNQEDKAVFNALSVRWEMFDPERVGAASYQNSNDEGVTIPEDDSLTFAKNRIVGSTVVGSTANLFYSSLNPHFSINGNQIVFEGSTMRPMSKMAAYNFLSSTFSDTAIATYSTTAASTNQVQLAHYSISVAGQGHMEIAYVFDACAIMGCLMILGYGYGFALLFACFKGLIQIFPKVLTGMIGSMRGIAGTCALVAALIVEIIGTCIMYALASMFIGSIYQLIEGPLAAILTSIVNLPSQAAALITVIASAIIILKLTMLLLKYRTAVVKSVSETATGFINKFMDTNVITPNLESGISAGGLASAGLGLAMVGSSTPIGSKLADRAEGLTDKMSNADPDKVASAAIGGGSKTGEHGERYASSEDAKKASDAVQASNMAAAGGGHYSSGDNVINAGTGDTLQSSSNQTPDDAAAEYVEQNAEDFEKEIGVSSDGKSGDSRLTAAGKAGDDSGTSGDYVPNEADADITAADYDASGKKIVDNSTTELSGTKSKDVSGETAGDVTAASDAVSANQQAGKSKLVGKQDQDTSSVSTGDESYENNVPASRLVMTDKNGNQSEVSVVNAKTGKAYTQEDKDNGENYDVIGKDGKSIYKNLDGGMSANTIALHDGEPALMVTPGSGGTNMYGGGETVQLAAAPVSEQAVSETVQSSGTATGTVSASSGGVSSVQSAGSMPSYAAAAQGSNVSAAQASSGTTVQQNIQQTTMQQTTANSAQQMTENVQQNVQASSGGGSNVGSAPQMEVIYADSNNGKVPVDVRVKEPSSAAIGAASAPSMAYPGGGSASGGNTYVHVTNQDSGSTSTATPVTNMEREVINTQTVESVIYGQGNAGNASQYQNSNSSGNPAQNSTVTNNIYNTNQTTVNEDSAGSRKGLGSGTLKRK